MNLINEVVYEILKPFIEISSLKQSDCSFIEASLFTQPELISIIEDCNIAGQVFESEVDVLGSYTLMSSPGLITLNDKELRQFFWSLIFDANKITHLRFRTCDLVNLAYLVVSKTYTHEQFHYYCDVVRSMNGARYDHLTEEALAVAWSYYQIAKKMKSLNAEISKIPNPDDQNQLHSMYQRFIWSMYQYKQPGYRDWNLYVDKDTLFDGIAKYLSIGKRRYLITNGIYLDKLIASFFTSLNSMGVEERHVLLSGKAILLKKSYTYTRKSVSQMKSKPPKFVGVRGGLAGIIKRSYSKIHNDRFICSYDASYPPSSEWMTYEEFEKIISSINP